MGSWDTKDDALVYIAQAYNLASYYSTEANVHTYHAWQHMESFETAAAVKDIISALYSQHACNDNVLSKWVDYEPSYAVPYFLANYAGGELTIIDLLAAYIDAEDDHRSAWQLLTDAYKASMYDKPFNKEYHSTWIQRFRSWV